MTRHTDWCARGHHCGLGEHRAAPIVVDLPGHGRAVLTRVQSRDGRHHAEITLTVALSPAGQVARWQLLTLLTDLRTLIGHVARAHLRKAG